MAGLELDGVTYMGTPVGPQDGAVLARLPEALARLLQQLNGFVAYAGGLHVRGVCAAPEWHSLQGAWEGPRALHALYPAVAVTDVPFAQDFSGDQLVLREGVVHRLDAEQGTLQSLGLDLWGFLHAARQDPLGFLRLEPMQALWQQGQQLAPGQLLSVWPPFMVQAERRSWRAVPAVQHLTFLAELAKKLKDAPEGTTVRFDVGKPPTHEE